jgi:hypothetical protein
LAVSGVARLQGVEGLVMAGPDETLATPCHMPMLFIEKKKLSQRFSEERF